MVVLSLCCGGKASHSSFEPQASTPEASHHCPTVLWIRRNCERSVSRRPRESPLLVPCRYSMGRSLYRMLLITVPRRLLLHSPFRGIRFSATDATRLCKSPFPLAFPRGRTPRAPSGVPPQGALQHRRRVGV